jgi:hypothetical protein
MEIAFDGFCLEGLGRASDAEGNWIGDEGARAIGEAVMGCTALRSLNLISEDGGVVVWAITTQVMDLEWRGRKPWGRG